MIILNDIKKEIEEYLREGINFNNILHNRLKDDTEIKDWFLKATELYSSNSEIERPIIFIPISKIDPVYLYQSKFRYSYIRKFNQPVTNRHKSFQIIEFQIDGIINLIKIGSTSPQLFNITDITRAQFKKDNIILYNYDNQNN